jgi:hypothetical protein
VLKSKKVIKTFIAELWYLFYQTNNYTLTCHFFGCKNILFQFLFCFETTKEITFRKPIGKSTNVDVFESEGKEGSSHRANAVKCPNDLIGILLTWCR